MRNILICNISLHRWELTLLQEPWPARAAIDFSHPRPSPSSSIDQWA